MMDRQDRVLLIGIWVAALGLVAGSLYAPLPAALAASFNVGAITVPDPAVPKIAALVQKWNRETCRRTTGADTCTEAEARVKEPDAAVYADARDYYRRQLQAQIDRDSTAVLEAARVDERARAYAAADAATRAAADAKAAERDAILGVQ